MKTIIALLTISIFFQINIFSQYTEAGIFVGASNYHGDLASRIMETSDYAPAFGAFARYNFTGRLAIKAHFYKGVLQGSDADSHISKGYRRRNLSFRSDIYELGLQVEYNILNYNLAVRDHITTPYIFAGVSGFSFNPQAELDGAWIDLQPLGTEGQGFPGNEQPYQLFGIGIPVGLGVKFSLNKNINLGLEFGVRKTFTDYIDDVSTVYPDLQLLAEEHGEIARTLSFRAPEYDENITLDPTGIERGNAENKDWYFFGGFTVSVNIGKVKDYRYRKGQPIKKKAPKMTF